MVNSRTTKNPFSNLVCQGLVHFVLLFIVVFSSISDACSAQVALAWESNNEPDLAGYRVFSREDGQGFDYNNPIWEGDKTETTCTLYGLDDNITYCFVVRAFDISGNESGDSNEACRHPPPPLATLVNLSISGPESVNEGSTAIYTATATFSDGSTQPATNSSHWTEDSSWASISDSGILTTSLVPNEQTVTITASYTFDSMTKTAQKLITVKDVSTTLENLSIDGPESVNEGSTANYTATATFSDGSTQPATNSSHWTEDSPWASISDSGILATSLVPSEQTVTITASYTFVNVTRTTQKTARIVDIEKDDSDSDGMPDWWENANGLNPFSDDSGEDSDTDGLNNLAEYENRTNPRASDSDGDGMPDGWEVANGLNPVSGDDAWQDRDEDGYANIEEYCSRTDPNDYSSTPQRPIADAGPEQIVEDNTTVMLSGSNSHDPDGVIMFYEWTQLDGTAVQLSDPYAAQPTFVAPDVGPDGKSLSFRLSVEDDCGLQTESTDTSVVNISWDNVPPTADAGPDQTVNEGMMVTLHGLNSTDPDGSIAAYVWKQTAGSLVTLSDATSAQPTFLAPYVGLAGEALTFQLTVQDDGGLADTDTAIINVSNVNQAPVADAGPDQTVEEGDTVTLDGSNSSDSDGDVVFHLWTQTDGTPVTLSNPRAVNPAFACPFSGRDKVLKFQLTVADTGELSAADSVSINVYPSLGNSVQTIFDLKAKATGKGIRLGWSPVQDTTGYNIYRSCTSGGPYNQIGNYPAKDKCTYRDNNVLIGVTYYYLVRSVKGETESLDSNKASTTLFNRGKK
jgi:hypothetical protein